MQRQKTWAWQHCPCRDCGGLELAWASGCQSEGRQEGKQRLRPRQQWWPTRGEVTGQWKLDKLESASSSWRCLVDLQMAKQRGWARLLRSGRQ